MVIKWIYRLTIFALLISGLLFTIILNPILSYSNKTTHKNFVIFHNQPLDKALLAKLDQATELLQSSELYNANLQINLCLNDGSIFPSYIKSIRGQAFAWGFYDYVILQGNANYQENYVELNSYTWNMIQLLVHEMIHCYQFDKLGLWKSKPIKNIPNWKWEGYAEYVSRQNTDQTNFLNNISRLNKSDKDKWEVKFADKTIVPREYYEYWVMVQYCMTIKNMTYEEILSDTINEQEIKQEMKMWYMKNRNEAHR